MSPPGCRPPFLKPKFHKKSKYGFKPISFRSPMGVIFSNYFFGAKNCRKNWTFCWFLKFYLNICAQVRPVLKNLISGLPGSVKKLQKYWKLNYFFTCYLFFMKHKVSGTLNWLNRYRYRITQGLLSLRVFNIFQQILNVLKSNFTELVLLMHIYWDKISKINRTSNFFYDFW